MCRPMVVTKTTFFISFLFIATLPLYVMRWLSSPSIQLQESCMYVRAEMGGTGRYLCDAFMNIAVNDNDNQQTDRDGV